MPPDHHESHGSSYGHQSWIPMAGYSQHSQSTSMSPMHEYGAFDYNHAPPTMEPTYSMPRPPPYAAGVPQLPPPLIMPHNGVWPSMLASQNQHNYPTPILPAAPIHTPISAGTGSDITPTSAKTTTSRRKLTDDERRQMCLEAEQNPTMKQTQIGAKFNVERSTVSKILRQKDKYMNPLPKEEVTSPGKKSKAKLPDFEKTLTNWVKNQQKKGLPVTDEELRKQARVFSFSRSDQALLSSPSWLETFKQNTNLLSDRGKSEHAVQGSGLMLQNETASNLSPSSSEGLVSPPMSAIDDVNGRGSFQPEHGDGYFDFETRHNYAQSSSMDHLLGAGLDHPSMLSPLSPELAPGRSDDLTDLSMQHFGSVCAGSRQRSQTFPHLPEHNSNTHVTGSEYTVPPLPVRAMTTTVVKRTIPSDPRSMMKRHKSVPDIHGTETVRLSSMQPPPLPRSVELSPTSDSASSIDDENIKALHTIKKLLEEHPGVADPDDYLAIGKLMEKLKLLRSPNLSQQLPGGMHLLDNLDSPRMSKKRTILGIST